MTEEKKRPAPKRSGEGGKAAALPEKSVAPHAGSRAPLRSLAVQALGAWVLAAESIKAYRLRRECPGSLVGERAAALEAVRDSAVERIEAIELQATKLASIVRKVVPFPADEQSRLVLFIKRCRAAARGSGELPAVATAIEHAARLWTLANAAGEPKDLREIVAEVAGEEPEAGRRRRAISRRQLLEGLHVIIDGTLTSTRPVADYIGASQSAVARHPLFKAAFATQVQPPRHRRSSRREKGLEPEEEED